MNKLQIRKSHKKWLSMTVGTGVLVGIVVIGVSFNGVPDLKQTTTEGKQAQISPVVSQSITNSFQGKYKIVKPIIEKNSSKKVNKTQIKMLKTQNHRVTVSPTSTSSSGTSLDPSQSEVYHSTPKPSPFPANPSSFRGSFTCITETIGSVSKTFCETTLAQADQAGQAWANKEQQIVDEQAKQAQDQVNAKYAQQDCQQIEQEQANAKAGGIAYQGPSCSQVYQDYGLPYPYPGN